MEYAGIMNILYGSAELAEIPDRWEQSVPFRCVIDGTECDAFLYWVTSSGKAEIRKMICIESETGKIRAFEPAEIAGRFGLSGLEFSPAPVTGAYFRAKDGYESFYASVCRKSAGQAGYSDAGKLLLTVVGKDCVKKILSAVAEDYMKKLFPAG